MTLAEIIALIRKSTNTSIGQISDAQMTIYVNIAYHLIENKIISSISDDYFYDIFLANLVANQNEYSIPASSSTVQGIKRILWVEVKYLAEDTYRTLTKNMQNDSYWISIDDLWVNQSKSNPIYDIKDSSIFIYPTPLNNVSNGLMIQGIVNLVDLVSWDWVDKIFPKATELRAWHWLISEWAKQFVYDEKKMSNEKISSINEFQLSLNNMIKSIQRNKKQVVTVTEVPAAFNYYKS